MTVLSARQEEKIDGLVMQYESERPKIKLFLEQVEIAIDGSADLKRNIHSIRTRLKDASHLRDKLRRKYAAAIKERKRFDITAANLLTKITDLAGARLLHLFTRQIGSIDSALRETIKEQSYSLVQGPFARTWDNESRDYFTNLGIETQDSPSMYTSVHYVVGSASRTKITCEIQVRTLMEEVWGEVDHSLNYPHPTDSTPCREQLKVLARVTSSASRLVDAIFVTHADWQARDAPERGA